MTRWSSCGLPLACTLVAARPAAAQDPAGPRTYDLTLEQALGLALARAPSVRVAQARVTHADLLLNTALAGIELEAEAGGLR